jgi:hypothetical protein
VIAAAAGRFPGGRKALSGGGSGIALTADGVGDIAPMTRLSQEEGVISPHDWKLNAEGRSNPYGRRSDAR